MTQQRRWPHMRPSTSLAGQRLSLASRQAPSGARSRLSSRRLGSSRHRPPATSGARVSPAIGRVLGLAGQRHHLPPKRQQKSSWSKPLLRLLSSGGSGGRCSDRPPVTWPPAPSTKPCLATQPREQQLQQQVAGTWQAPRCSRRRSSRSRPAWAGTGQCRHRACGSWCHARRQSRQQARGRATPWPEQAPSRRRPFGAGPAAQGRAGLSALRPTPCPAAACSTLHLAVLEAAPISWGSLWQWSLATALPACRQVCAGSRVWAFGACVSLLAHGPACAWTCSL